MIKFNTENFYETKFNGYYVSKSGKVLSTRSGTPKLRKLCTDKYGYVRLCFALRENEQVKRYSYFVHSLMLETFKGERPDGYVVDHIDDNPQNNHIDNLRYISNTENIRKAHVGVSPKGKIKTTIILDGRRFEFPSIRQGLNFLNLSRGQFERIRNGQTKLLNFSNISVTYTKTECIIKLDRNDSND